MQDIFIGGNGQPDPEEEERLLDQPAARNTDRGMQWIYEAGLLFGEHWQAWMIIAAVLYVVELVFQGIIANMGFMVASVYGMFMLFKAGGIVMAASVQEYEETPPRLGHFFMIFDGKAFEFVFLFVLLLLAALFWGIMLFGMASAIGFSGGLADMVGTVSSLFLTLFWLVSLQILLGFAPVLVFLQSESPFAAIVLSVKAAVKNILPLLLNSFLFMLLYMPVLWLANIAHGTLFAYITTALVLMLNMISYLSTYAAYRDIWFESAERNTITMGYR